MNLHLLFFVAALLVASHVRAEANDYVQAIERAVAAYNAGDFASAREHFGGAHALRPNARTWRGMGTCDFELGRWSEASEELSHALEDTRAPLSHELRARTEAQLELARSRVPAPVLQPSPEPAPAALPAVVLQEEPPVAPAKRSFGVKRGLAVASLVVGVAGIALATGYGLRSMHEGDTRDGHCDASGACTDVRGVHAGDAAIRTGNLASAGWIVGGAGLVSSVALFWADRASRRADRPRAQLRIGPTSLAIVGTL